MIWALALVVVYAVNYPLTPRATRPPTTLDVSLTACTSKLRG